MINLIFGRAKSGKTTYIQNLIKKTAENGTDNIIYIVPEQLSFKTEYRMLSLFGNDSNGIVEKVLNFKKLAKMIISQSGYTAKPLIDENCRRVYMSTAVESVKDSLEIFKNCSKSYAAGCLIGIATELSQCAVTVSDLKKSAEQSGDEILKKKTRELSLILEAYKTLVETGFSDGLDEQETALKLSEDIDFFKGKTVFIDEFSGFTNSEYKFIRQMAEKCDNVYITLCLDGLTDIKTASDVFFYTQKTAQRLFNISKLAGTEFHTVECNSDPFKDNPALKSIEHNLYSGIKRPFNEKTDAVTVTLCENAMKEADYIAMTVKKLVRENGYRYKDFAVIERGCRIAPYFRSSFKKYGIPVFEDSRRLLKTEALVRFVSDALTAVNNNFDSEFILRCAKTNLFSLTQEEIGNLENYVFVWQINKSDWLKEWINHPDGYGYTADDGSQNRLNALNETRKKIITPLTELKNALDNANGFDGVRAIYNFLIKTEADKNLLKTAEKLNSHGRTDLAAECERVWNEFMIILDRFANTLNEYTPSLPRFCELFNIMLDNADTGEIPSYIDEITVGDALRVRLDGKKVVFIAGANEGIFPQSNEASFVLTKKERKLLKNGNLELYEDGELFSSKERFLVYYASTRPSDKLYITYSSGEANGTAMVKSEIIGQITDCVPGLTTVENAFIPPVEKTESVSSAFECLAEHFNDNSTDSASLKEYLSSKDEYSGKVKALERASKKEKSRIKSPETATELFGKNMRLSPSAIERYHKCPFMYFCFYGVGAKKTKKAELAPNIRGLVIHEVLEKLFKKYDSQKLCSLDEINIKTEISTLTEEYITEKMGGKTNIDEKTLYSLMRIESNIYDICKRLIYEFKHSKFITDAMELPIKNGGPVDEYKINLKNGGTLSLYGTVDRVDRFDTENGTYIRVVDYKTGGKELKLDETMAGLNLQMIIYLMCILQNGGKLYGDNLMPAGVLYLPAKGGEPVLERHNTDEDLRTELIKQGQMNGVVLSVPEVMEAMDTTGEGIFLSNKIIKNGKPGRYALTVKQMKKLFNETNRIVKETAESIQSGDIAVYPMIQDKTHNACIYCDYKSVCCYEENDEHNTVLKCEDKLLNTEG